MVNGYNGKKNIFSFIGVDVALIIWEVSIMVRYGDWKAGVFDFPVLMGLAGISLFTNLLFDSLRKWAQEPSLPDKEEKRKKLGRILNLLFLLVSALVLGGTVYLFILGQKEEFGLLSTTMLLIVANFVLWVIQGVQSAWALAKGKASREADC